MATKGTKRFRVNKRTMGRNTVELISRNQEIDTKETLPSLERFSHDTTRYRLEGETDNTGKESYTHRAIQNTIPINTLARMNAMINHSSCIFHVNIDNVYKRVTCFSLAQQQQMIISYDGILGEIHNACYNWRRPIILYLGKCTEEAVSHVNLLLKYGKLNGYIIEEKALCISHITKDDNEYIRAFIYDPTVQDEYSIIKHYYEPIVLRLAGTKGNNS